MNNHKIVLVNPNHKGNYVQGTFLRENLGLGYLAAYLRQSGFHVKILDSRIENNSFQTAASKIAKIKPFLVGFSVIAKDGIEWCEKVAKILKRKKDNIPHICLGNYFPTLQPTRALESMPSADSIVLGEGEITLTKLANNLLCGKEWRQLVGLAYRRKSRIVVNKRRRLILDLDKLPLPEHYASKYHLSEFAIEGSRGCYCACSFCSISPFVQAKASKDRWRFRSALSIVNEVHSLSRKFPQIKIFRFVDPDFVGSFQHLDRLKKIISELKEKKINITFIIDTRTEVINNISSEIWQEFYEVGLREVYLGVETTSSQIKKMMFKRSNIKEDVAAISLLNNIGIKTRFGFMMITPWSNAEDMVTSAKMLRNLGFSRLDKYFQEMYLVPGTDAVNLVKKNTKIWFDYNGKGEYYAYELPSPLDELRKICRFLIESYPDFLNQVQLMHENVRQCEINEYQVKRLKHKLNDFNYHVFMSLFKAAKKVSSDTNPEMIQCCAREVIKKYQPRIINLKKEIDFIKK